MMQRGKVMTGTDIRDLFVNIYKRVNTINGNVSTTTGQFVIDGENEGASVYGLPPNTHAEEIYVGSAIPRNLSNDFGLEDDGEGFACDFLEYFRKRYEEVTNG
jgi:hypothetical protein